MLKPDWPKIGQFFKQVFEYCLGLVSAIVAVIFVGMCLYSLGANKCRNYSVGNATKFAWRRIQAANLHDIHASFTSNGDTRPGKIFRPDWADPNGVVIQIESTKDGKPIKEYTMFSDCDVEQWPISKPADGGPELIMPPRPDIR